MCDEAIELLNELKEVKSNIKKLQEENDVKGKTARLKQLQADIAEEKPDMFEHREHLFGKTSKQQTVYAKKTVADYLDEEGHEDFVQKYTRTVDKPICMAIKKKRKRR